MSDGEGVQPCVEERRGCVWCPNLEKSSDYDQRRAELLARAFGARISCKCINLLLGCEAAQNKQKPVSVFVGGSVETFLIFNSERGSPEFTGQALTDITKLIGSRSPKYSLMKPRF